MKIAIIGAGASGLMMASYLNKKTNYQITIFERNKELGRKILASGNGRCNLFNTSFNELNYNDIDFANKLNNYFTTENLEQYFKELGLLCYTDSENRAYPISENSKTVLNVLLDSLNNTTIMTDTLVTKINKINNLFYINDFKEGFDYLVIASGSCAGIIKYKQDSVYEYLKNYNFKITQLKPGLVGLRVKENVNSLKGLRVKVFASLYFGNKHILSEDGEVIFKSDGISGIVIMNMSNYINYLNKDNEEVYIKLDLLPKLEYEYLKEFSKKTSIKGLINPLLYTYLLNYNELEKIELIKNFKLSIKSAYDFSDAQVVNGGICLSVVNDDLSYKYDKNIYIIGEALNIDGRCGGHNLSFAFKSGIVASNGIMKYEIKS